MQTINKERRPGGGTPRRLKGVKHWTIDAFSLPHGAGAVKCNLCGVLAVLAALAAMLALDGLFVPGGKFPAVAACIGFACVAGALGRYVAGGDGYGCQDHQ